MSFINHNGKLVPPTRPLYTADNRGYRYGDGLFETMKVVNGKIQLAAFHFERLWEGLELMEANIPALVTAERLEKEILTLCIKNDCNDLGRVRLSLSRGNGGLYDGDDSLQYTIEAWPLPDTIQQLNENGLVIDIYPHARKSCDRFANLKSANFLPYVMAARYARQHKFNDCLVLNQYERVADASIANVFLIQGDTLLTPSLTEGCVKGVMRRKLLEEAPAFGWKVKEAPILLNDLLMADEIFLTNSTNGLRWVKNFRDKFFPQIKTRDIYQKLTQIL
ncbi:MAG TPA: aminotransferase class IV [Chitinophagaceae bacterium]|jgi:branched-chain amino acid aminotransferase|nr:aminotransferase class IV [Chitinophagaceae bacterium]